MPDLRVTLVQSMLQWEDAPANRKQFEERFVGLKGTTDLVVLPEMFNTGFTMDSAAVAESMDGPTVAWMREQAAALDAALYGSLVILENGTYTNRGLFVRPDGSITGYDKRHLFRMANEHQHFSPGEERVVVDWRGWRVLLQVCYDLRFPVFSRNKGDYDLVLYVACWPEVRRYPWSQLLIARAIENLAYVVGVNRVGMDGKGIHYSGDSAAVDFKGEVLVELEAGREMLRTLRLHGQSLLDFRERFPAQLDVDRFTLE